MCGEIWSIVLTTEGVGACALGLDMKKRVFEAPWSIVRNSGARAVEHAAVMRLVARALRALLDEHKPPLALAIASPDCETACFVDRDLKPASPIFLSGLLDVPRSSVPERFEVTAETVQAYRNSVLRRIQQTQPTFGLNAAFGLWSLGASVMYALTGHDICACAPRGDVQNISDYDEFSQKLLYQAMGVKPDLCSRRVRPGIPVARISPQMIERLHAEDLQELQQLAGIPVYDMGCADGAFAYSVGSNPLSWSLRVGWDLRVKWPAGVSALSTYEIQIIDRENKQEQTEDVTEMSADDWTKSMHEKLALESSPGMGKSLRTYGLSLPAAYSQIIENAIQSLCDADTGRIPAKTLHSVPLGSNGLHLYCDSYGWKLMGLSSAHSCVHMARALFESLIYQVHSWRDTLIPKGAGPVRVCIQQPWPAECAQWIADILGSDIHFIPESAEQLAAFGAALSLMRSLEIQASPVLKADVVEPSESAAAYGKHFAIHQYLGG